MKIHINMLLGTIILIASSVLFMAIGEETPEQLASDIRCPPAPAVMRGVRTHMIPCDGGNTGYSFVFEGVRWGVVKHPLPKEAECTKANSLDHLRIQFDSKQMDGTKVKCVYKVSDKMKGNTLDNTTTLEMERDLGFYSPHGGG